MVPQRAEMIKQHCAFISLIDIPNISSIIYNKFNEINGIMQNPKNLVLN